MNRRRFLGLAGAAACHAAAGCVGGLDALGGREVGGEWSAFGRDHANTGHAPDAAGPASAPGVVWEADAATPAAATAPVVVGERTYVGGASAGGLYALDAATGDDRWTFDADARVASPPAVADGTVYVATDAPGVRAVDAATGDGEWTARLDGRVGDSSPTVADGRVYVGTGGDARTASADDDGSPTGGVVALDAATGEHRWTYATAGRVTTTPAVVDGRVYVGDASGRVRALDAETGEQSWALDLDRPVRSSPAVADDTVFFGAGGTLFAVDTDAGDPHWTVDLRWPRVTTSPAVAGDTVYVGCHGADVESCTDEGCESAALYALDADYGAKRWRYDVAGALRSSPAAADGRVYVGRGGGVSAVRADEGTEAWGLDLGADVDAAPAVAGGLLFVTAADGTAYALGE